MLANNDQKLFIQLSSIIDPNRYYQLSKNAQRDELNKPTGNLYLEVKSLSEASKLCLDFIKRYNLGGSNFTGGRVVDENYNLIAEVSYNGRVWKDMNDNNRQEIIVE